MDGGSPYLTGSAPQDGETSVPRDSLVAVRFSKPLRVETVNAQNVTLTGSGSAIAVKVVPTENGMLAFVTPVESLAAGSMYKLSISNAADKEGFPVPPTSASCDARVALRPPPNRLISVRARVSLPKRCKMPS